MSCTRLTALALAAAGLAASGCGGSSSKTGSISTSADATTGTATSASAPATTTTPVIIAKVKVASGKPLTRAQWIAKGDAICARVNAELETVSSKTIAELRRTLPQSAAYERVAVAELAKLVPPTAMVNDWQQFLTDTLQSAEDAVKLGESVGPGQDVLKSPLATTIRAVREQMTKVAKRDGFKACSLT